MRKLVLPLDIANLRKWTLSPKMTIQFISWILNFLQKIKKSNIRQTLNFIFLILGVSCSQSEFKDPDTGPKSDLSVLDLKNQDMSELFTVRVDPTDTPKLYMVQFNWPTLSAGVAVRIKQGQNQSPLLINQNSFSHQVSHNQNLSYTFELLDESKKIIRSTVKNIKIPLDLVINEAFKELNQDAEIAAQRLFLGSEPLITNGFNFSLTVNEIISAEGNIKTFRNTPIENNQNKKGRSSGNIHIKAKTLIGKLNIEMIAGQGGPGTNGLIHTGRALDGKNASYPNINCERNRPDPGDRTKPGEIPHSFFCICGPESRATAGQNGLTGNAGGVGASGGDTGSVQISIDQVLKNKDSKEELLVNTSRFVNISHLPGTGGPGGTGSSGQAGGMGGYEYKHQNCTSPKASDGSAGPPGASGPFGPAGKKGQTCVYIASEEINECN